MPRALGLVAATAILAGGALAGTAGAAPVPGGAPSTGWIAFGVSPSSNLTPGQTVTISKIDGTANAADLGWPLGLWPSTGWSVNGLDFQPVGPVPCLATSNSCSFTVTGSSGPHEGVFWDAGTLPPGEEQQLQQNSTVTVQQPPPPTTTPPPTEPPTTVPPGPNSHFNGPGGTIGPGTPFTFTAPGDLGVTYAWALTSNGAAVPNGAGTGVQYNLPASVFSSPTSTYTLTLTATNLLQRSTQSSVTFEVVTNVPASPAQPSPPSAAPVAPPAAPPPVAKPAAPGSFTRVSFSPALVDFATPKPGAVQPVTVIWLWRPDWFQSTGVPKTSGRPSSAKRANVSVDPTRGSPSATPWLAGLAVFGIFGAAWLAVRRRRVRTSILD